jgi:nitroimidazol reductase NimA-like FMN-containing flavoprotein (pyridoxamine 5'-phosphate oxidase superfamily)
MPNAASPASPATERTRVRRVADRGRYDKDTLYAIVDAAYVCHLAFADAAGVHCIPTACWREGEHLYIHGSNGSRLLKMAADGAQVCVTITHLDGLVLARSAFHHSMNYRSAMIYGVFERVPDGDKPASLDAFMEKLAAGRSGHVRRGDANELAATTVLRIALDETACKIRTGGPKDDADDLSRDVWAGVLPLALAGGAPVQDGAASVVPEYVARWAAR